jgi:hypothetical protein
MFKKILIANRGDNAAGVAAKGDFAHAKSAAATTPGSRRRLICAEGACDAAAKSRGAHSARGD